MLKRSPLIFLFFSLVLISNLYPQGFSYKRFTVKDGLPSNEVGHVCQDKQGYIWFISGDNLVRYDGLKFLVVSDKTYKGWSLFDENITYCSSMDKFVFLNGAKVVTAKYDFKYYPVDSNFVYFYDQEKEAYRYFDSYVNNDGYILFSRDKCRDCFCTSDTLYYWHNSKTHYLRFPEGYKRNERNVFLLKDVDGNIYLRLKSIDTEETSIFKFSKGKLQKVLSYRPSSGLADHGQKIVQEKKGGYWVYSDSAVCLFRNEKLIKGYDFSFFKHTLLSEPILDAKNDLWISSENGLVRINENTASFYEDPCRRPKEFVETRYDNGKASETRKRTYMNFYATNFKDRFDNIFNGYRMFDGHTFSDWGNRYGEFTNDFWRSGKDLAGDNSLDLLEGFADDQDNIWFTTSKGLVLASPVPYKCKDLTYTFDAQEYKFNITDLKGRNYYLKLANDSGLARIAVQSKGNISHYKFKLPKGNESQGFYLSRFGKGVVIENFDDQLNFIVTVMDSGIVKQIKFPGIFYKAINYNDTLVYHGKSGFVVGTPQGWYMINDVSIPVSQTAYAKRNKMILHDLNYYQIVGNNVVKGKFFNYNWSDTALKCYNSQWTLIDKIDPLADTFYILNKYFKIYRKEGKKETVFQFDEKDPWFNKMKNEKGWNLFRINIIKDLLLLSTQNNGVLIYSISEKDKKLVFHSLLDYAAGLPAKNEYYMLVEGNYVSVWSPFPNCLKIWNYENLKSKSFDNNYEFLDLSVDIMDGVPTINAFGQREVNTMISYVGERGFNMKSPPIAFDQISYTSGKDLLHVTTTDQKQIQLKSDFHDLYISFKGICLAEGNKLKYKTRLLGFDTDWQISDAVNNFIRYPSLSPGSYTFEVKACNNHGVWNDEPIRFSFEVLYPWYRTWLAYFAYLVLGGFGIYAFDRSRTKKLVKEKEKLERTVEERTKEVVEQKELAEHQKNLVEEKQKEILDSINYAKRIQYTLLAHSDFLKENISDHFVFFNPKDIVSGDFYWAAKKGGKFYLAVCDSTGHGVPGAFMSLLNISFLNEAITEKGLEQPNHVFDFVRQRLIDNISKEGQKDGFDGILVCFDSIDHKITYASANNAPILIQNGLLVELPSDRMPVGKGERIERFKLFDIPYKKGDTLYLYTDGYPDQFGGPRGKKYMYKRLNEKLQSISNKDLKDQMKELKHDFDHWKGDLEQVDDVCIVGIKL